MQSQFNDLIDKRIVFITGKGGVGRSSVTAALARAAARRGKRVLLAEIADHSEVESTQIHYSPLAKLFGLDQLPESKEPIADSIWASQLVPIKGHELFLASVFRVGALARAALHSEALRRLFQAAPSIREIGIFYCLLHYLREEREGGGGPANELILVDMPATGHTLALTGLPDVLLRMVQRGPIADALKEGQSYINDPRQSAAYIVTLPESLPVSETIELLEGLKQTKMPIGGVILNHCPLDPFTAEERTALSEHLAGETRAGRTLLGQARFIYFEEARREIERLEDKVGSLLLRLPDAPTGCASVVDFLADEFAGAST